MSVYERIRQSYMRGTKRINLRNLRKYQRTNTIQAFIYEANNTKIPPLPALFDGSDDAFAR